MFRLRLVLIASLAISLPSCNSSSGGGAAQSSDQADLAGLTLSGATLSPAFRAGEQDYTARVESSFFATSVTATAADAAARITVDGQAVASGSSSRPFELARGESKSIDVVVRASDGGVKTYTITARRDALPTLAGLSLSTGTLTPRFDRDTTEYQLSVGFLTSAVHLTPTAVASTIRVGDEVVAPGRSSGAVSLPDGSSEIVIGLTDVQGMSRDYRIDVSRGAVTSLAQEAYAKASNAEATDQLGWSVAIDGDTMAVGAFGESSSATNIAGDQLDNAANNSGAVYVFERSDGGWSQQAYLKASNCEADDLFGFRVALDGDTLAVSAIGESSSAVGVDGDQADNAAVDSGAVYVFSRNGAAWSQQAYLKASNAAAGDTFGDSLALDGDTLAVGAAGEASAATGVGGDETDDSIPSSGAVYVFARTAGTWSQQAYIKASNSEAGDMFGNNVALSGETLAVGARREASSATGINGDETNDSAPACGAVYVFTRAVNSWSQQAYIKASNTEANDEFGRGLALDGDTLAVGAPIESSSAVGIDGVQGNNSAPTSGAVYVFTRSGVTWTQQAYVKAFNTGAGDSFGQCVALAGDTMAVGAFGESSSMTGLPGNQFDDLQHNSGAAYVFTRSDGLWSQQTYIKASNTGSFDFFGWSLDLDGDALAIAAVGESSSAIGIGGEQVNDDAAASGAVSLPGSER